MAAAVIFVSGTRLYAEKSVEGDDEHGRIDFGVTRLGDDQLICVTEAKIEDIRGGFAQALSALEGTLQVCMKMMSRVFKKVFLDDNIYYDIILHRRIIVTDTITPLKSNASGTILILIMFMGLLLPVQIGGMF